MTDHQNKEGDSLHVCDLCEENPIDPLDCPTMTSFMDLEANTEQLLVCDKCKQEHTEMVTNCKAYVMELLNKEENNV